MNMSISTDVVSATQSQPHTVYRPPMPPDVIGETELPNAVEAVAKVHSPLASDIKSSMLAGIRQLEESGASLAEINSYVLAELAANKIDVPPQQHTGQLLDIMS